MCRAETRHSGFLPSTCRPDIAVMPHRGTLSLGPAASMTYRRAAITGTHWARVALLALVACFAAAALLLVPGSPLAPPAVQNSPNPNPRSRALVNALAWAVVGPRRAANATSCAEVPSNVPSAASVVSSNERRMPGAAGERPLSRHVLQRARPMLRRRGAGRHPALPRVNK